MGKKAFVAAFTIFLLLMSILSLRAVFGPNRQASGKLSRGDAVGIIRVEGAITGDSSASWSGTQTSTDEVLTAIREAARRDDIKAVVLRINSPGGSAVSAQEIGIELDKLRALGKPVVTSMGDTCASGGYWIACSTDYIMANSTTMTGSIGVIMELTNLEGLYGKLGISQEAIKSGEYKDIGSASRQLKPEERQLLQDMVQDSYQQFVDQVAKGRQGRIDQAQLKSIADGRVLTGKQAKAYGLVDGLGNYYDAVREAQKRANLDENGKSVELGETLFWEELMSGSGLSSLLQMRLGPVLRY
ncbi:MAG: signal peptide peptidase SppA [Syntrophomonas sp.]